MRNQRPAAPLAVASISRGTGCRSEASFDMGATVRCPTDTEGRRMWVGNCEDGTAKTARPHALRLSREEAF